MGESIRPMMTAFDESEYDEPVIASTFPIRPRPFDFAHAHRQAGRVSAIVVTDTFPPKYIYDGDEWFRPARSPAASMRVN